MLTTKIIEKGKIEKIDIMKVVSENASRVFDTIDIRTLDEDTYTKYRKEGKMTNCIKCKVENVLDYFDNPLKEINKLHSSFLSLEDMMIDNDY